MRLFLAINSPAEIRRAVWDAAAPLRVAAPALSWVAEPRIHLTLKFIGEQPDEVLAPLIVGVKRIAASHIAPLVRVEGIGAFPNFRRPRVVWIGVTPEPRLELLHHDLEVACAARGFELDGRPFRPHMTLARVPDRAPAEQLRGLRSAAAKVRFTDEFTVTSVDVMRSDLGSGGAVYTMLASASLKGA
jgi:RNA 2',3'-cyclic 3'-phosphodiesterase